MSKGSLNKRVFDSLTESIGPLEDAMHIQMLCAEVGFDWVNIFDVLQKVKEEINEIEEELDCTDIVQARVEEEIGDAFFALINLARHANVDPQQAIQNANQKFMKRFKHVETACDQSKESLRDMPLSQMEKLWQQAKKQV